MPRAVIAARENCAAALREVRRRRIDGKGYELICGGGGVRPARGVDLGFLAAGADEPSALGVEGSTVGCSANSKTASPTLAS